MNLQNPKESAKTWRLYIGYSYNQERRFKELRERRTIIHQELVADALAAGMILQKGR